MPEAKAMNELIAESLARIARCMFDDRIELSQGVKLYSELIHAVDPNGDLSSPLRPVREMHAKISRSMRKAHGCKAEVACKMSLCAWFEAWRRSEVLEPTLTGHRLRFTLESLQISEKYEDELASTPVSMMQFVTLDTLTKLKNLTELRLFEDLKQDIGVMVELQVILAKRSDGKVFIYIFV